MKYLIVAIFYLSTFLLFPMPALGGPAIDLGACAGTFNPIKWSPDGSRVAFFRQGQIVITDTLGSQEVIGERRFTPRVFDWIDDHELLIHDIVARESNSVTFEVIRVHVESGVVRHVDEYRRTRGKRDETFITFPYRTTGGLPYYTKYSPTGEAQTIFPKGQVDANTRSQAETKGTVLKALADGLYLVSLDQVDTTKVFDRPINNSIINSSHTYIMYDGTIIRLSDGQQTILDTMFTGIPDSTYVCGFESISFSEEGNLAAFVRFCDDGHMYEVSQAGLYDIRNEKLTIIDKVVGLTNCTSPVISSNGRYVAFLCKGNAFMLALC